MPLPKRVITPSEKAKIEEKKKMLSAPSGGGGLLGGIGKYVRMLGNALYPDYENLVSDMDKAGPRAQEKARTINEGLKSALDYVLSTSTLPPEQAIEEFALNPNRLDDLRRSFIKDVPVGGEEQTPELEMNAPEVALREEIEQGVGQVYDAPAEEEIEDKEALPEEEAESLEEIEGIGGGGKDGRQEDLLSEEDEPTGQIDEDAEQEMELDRLLKGRGRLASVVQFGLEIKRAAVGARKMASGWSSPRLPGRFFGSKAAMIKAAWRDTPTQFGRKPVRKQKPGDKSSGYCTRCRDTTPHELLEGGKEKCLAEGCGAVLSPTKASKNVVVRTSSELK